MFPKCLNILHGVACTWSSVTPILAAWVVVLHSDLLFIRSLCCHYCVTLMSQFRWKAFNFCYAWVTSLVQKSVLCKITDGNITVHKKSEVFSGKIHGVRWPLSLIPSKISYFLPCSQIVNKIYSYLFFFKLYLFPRVNKKTLFPRVPWYVQMIHLIQEPMSIVHSPIKRVWTSKTVMTFLTWKAAIPRNTSRK